MRLHADGFDHYGTTESFMLDNVYANAASGVGPTGQAQLALSTAQVATGTHSLHFLGPSSGQLALRKVLPSSKTKLGAAARFYFPSLPTDNTAACIFSFNTSTPNVSQLSFMLDSNGSVRIYRGVTNDAVFGNGGTLLATTDPLITSGAFNHIEVQANISDSAGWIRIAVNGVHRYASATNLDTQNNSDGVVSVSHGQMYNPTTSLGQFYMDDLYYYDFVGDSGVDTDFCPTTDGSGVATGYIGELQCMWLVPNADTAQDDWTPSTGSDAYAMIDEVDPNDADYISSVADTDLSEFALSDLPPEITYIRGVDVWGRMSKSDAGVAMVKFGMKSVASVLDSSEFPITVVPSYWTQQRNIDPNTAAATGVLTFSGQPANAETVTIGAKVYTFQTVLTNVDGNVLIGANLAASIANLAAAINGGAGSGTSYAAATVTNTQVTGAESATTLTITAIEAGTGGNSIATTETVANASWGGATMSGGDAGSRWTRASLNAAWVRLLRTV